MADFFALSRPTCSCCQAHFRRNIGEISRFFKDKKNMNGGFWIFWPLKTAIRPQNLATSLLLPFLPSPKPEKHALHDKPNTLFSLFSQSLLVESSLIFFTLKATIPNSSSPFTRPHKTTYTHKVLAHLHIFSSSRLIIKCYPIPHLQY